MDNKQEKLCEVQLAEPTASFEVFGMAVHIPPSSNLNTVLLAVLIIQSVVNLFKTKPVEFAVDLLRGADLVLLENLDNMAVAIREATNADRVLVVGFHNGKKNTVYHWKRLSVLAESCRLGIEPIRNKFKDVDTGTVLTKYDYDTLTTINKANSFVHNHLEMVTISTKQKRFLINCHMVAQHSLLLMDEDTNLPHGIIFIQYDRRDRDELAGGDWSAHTTELAYSKAQIVNNLIYEKAKSLQDRALRYAKNILRL